MAEGVVETKVHASINEDSNGRDGEPSIETLDTIRLEGLDVNINKAVELSFATLPLGIIGKPGPGVRNDACNVNLTT